MLRNILEMEEINKFDDFIKKGLDQLGTDLPTGDWNDFAEKLNAQELPLDNNPSGFDDLIRQQMGDLQIDFDASHWNSLESKIDTELNTPQITDEALDELVTDELQHLYVPYNTAHWTLMSHRLDEEFSVRRKIVKYKIAEVSLMLVLLFTILPYLPDYSVPHNQSSTAISTDEILSEQQTENLSLATDEITVPVQVMASLTTADSDSKNTTAPSAGLAASEKAISNIDDNKTTVPSSLFIEKISQPIDNQSVGKLNQVSKLPVVPVKAVVLEKGKEQAMAKAINSLSHQSVKAHAPALLLAALPQSSPSILQNKDWNYDIGLLKKFKKSVVVKIGAVSSLDVNKVKTPNTSSYKDNGYHQYRLGYGGGIVMDLTYEKLTFSSGLVYRRINYTPEETVNIGGTFISGYQSHVFDAVNLNLLTIPMNFQFQIGDPDRKWKWYALTGASLNILALNHYNVTVNNLGTTTTPPSSIPVPQSPGVNPQELYEENEVANEGLFEGGSFQRNHYFTTNFGLGVERFISRRWSLFIQPVYQYEIFDKNLGPNNDRIHTFSVQIGAKSSFR